ncbi:hypothetical protein HDK77DRAFT_429914 [Phyllosticta capitalensis]
MSLQRSQTPHTVQCWLRDPRYIGVKQQLSRQAVSVARQANLRGLLRDPHLLIPGYTYYNFLACLISLLAGEIITKVYYIEREYYISIISRGTIGKRRKIGAQVLIPLVSRSYPRSPT